MRMLPDHFPDPTPCRYYTHSTTYQAQQALNTLPPTLSRGRALRAGYSALLLVRTPHFLPVSGVSFTTVSGWITRFKVR